MKKLKIGIVGAGRLGGFHADKAAANERVELVGVFDPCETNRRRVARKHSVQDFDDLNVFASAIDAAVVATPSVLHFELANELLRSGKHLLVEKPMTTTAEDARRLADLARQNRLILQCGQVEQYNPAWISVQPFLSEIRRGKRAFIETSRTSGYTFRSVDVGVVLDLMIHDLELIVSLIDEPLQNVSATGFVQFGGFEDSAFAQLEFANGTVVRLTASRIEQEATRSMKIVDETQSIRIDFQSRTARRFQTSEKILRGDFAPSRLDSSFVVPSIPDFMRESYPSEELVNDPFDALSLEMENFVSAVLDGTPSRVPAERVVRAIEFAETIVQKIDSVRSIRLHETSISADNAQRAD